MKIQTCCFTGHRNIPKNKATEIQKRLEEQVVKLIHQGVLYYGAGGALGFDTLGALAVLKLKKKYPAIKLILVLPCKEQPRSWCEQDNKVYEQICGQADKVVYTSETYWRGCMHKRNRHLVDHSQYCICYLNQTSGGTAYTVNYAIHKGLQVINIC